MYEYSDRVSMYSSVITHQYSQFLNLLIGIFTKTYKYNQLNHFLIIYFCKLIMPIVEMYTFVQNTQQAYIVVSSL